MTPGPLMLWPYDRTFWAHVIISAKRWGNLNW